MATAPQAARHPAIQPQPGHRASRDLKNKAGLIHVCVVDAASFWSQKAASPIPGKRTRSSFGRRNGKIWVSIRVIHACGFGLLAVKATSIWRSTKYLIYYTVRQIETNVALSFKGLFTSLVYTLLLSAETTLLTGHGSAGDNGVTRRDSREIPIAI